MERTPSSGNAADVPASADSCVGEEDGGEDSPSRHDHGVADVKDTVGVKHIGTGKMQLRSIEIMT